MDKARISITKEEKALKRSLKEQEKLELKLKTLKEKEEREYKERLKREHNVIRIAKKTL